MVAAQKGHSRRKIVGWELARAPKLKFSPGAG